MTALAATPLALRAALGLAGLLLLVAGARLYHLALYGSAFTLGASASGWAMTWVLAPPEIVLLGSLLTGIVTTIVVKTAHRLGLIAIGSLTGLALGASIAGQLGAAPLLPSLGGSALGALLFPRFFPSLLKVLTPLIGALCLVHATGHADRLWLVALLWAGGAAIQLLGGSATKVDDRDK